MAKDFSELTDDEWLEIAGRLLLESDRASVENAISTPDAEAVGAFNKSQIRELLAKEKSKLDKAAYYPVYATRFGSPLLEENCDVSILVHAKDNKVINGVFARTAPPQVLLASKFDDFRLPAPEFIPNVLAPIEDAQDERQTELAAGTRFRLSVDDPSLDLRRVLSVQIRKMPELHNRPPKIKNLFSEQGVPESLIKADFVELIKHTYADPSSIEFSLGESISALSEYALILVVSS